jgi:hypothetical protein
LSAASRGWTALAEVYQQSEKTLTHDELRDVVRESFELARDLVPELQIENWRLEGEGVEIHERTAARASLLLDHMNKTPSDPASPMVLVDPDLLEFATFTPTSEPTRLQPLSPISAEPIQANFRLVVKSATLRLNCSNPSSTIWGIRR